MTDTTIPLPEPVAWQRMITDPDDAPHYYWEEISEWEAMNCTADKDRRQLHTAGQLRAYGDARAAEERERCAAIVMANAEACAGLTREILLANVAAIRALDQS